MLSSAPFIQRFLLSYTSNQKLAKKMNVFQG